MSKAIQEILNREKKKQKSRGGKPNSLSMEDRLLMALEYLREYRTYFHLGQSYGLSESACYRTCCWIENTLIKSREFSLPGRKALLKSDNQYEVILIDAAESPKERPKKRVRKRKKIKNRNNKQKYFYSGKKKRHTLKTQVVVAKNLEKSFVRILVQVKNMTLNCSKRAGSDGQIKPRQLLIQDIQESIKFEAI